jgi:O-antigen/teichoic acid export membrane protein
MLVFQTDQYFIASFKGADAIPAYRAAYLVVLNLNMLAITFASSSSVFVSHLWQAGELKQLHRIVQRNLRLGLLIMLCGGACVLGLGSSLFDAWIGPGKFIGYPTLIVFVALLALETHSYIIVASSRATEDEAFAFSMPLAGLLKLGLSWLLMQRYGLLGIAAGTLIAQLLTNNWFMVYRGLRRLRMSLREHLKGVLIPVAVVFVLVLACNFALLRLLPTTSPVIQTITAGALTGVLLAVSCWTLVLAKSERARLLSFVGLVNTPVNPSKA